MRHRLIEQRTAHRWTQKEVGKRIGWKHSIISDVERGRKEVLSNKEIELLARAYEMPVAEVALDRHATYTPTSISPALYAGVRGPIRTPDAAKPEHRVRNMQVVTAGVLAGADDDELQALLSLTDTKVLTALNWLGVVDDGDLQHLVALRLRLEANLKK